MTNDSQSWPLMALMAGMLIAIVFAAELVADLIRWLLA
jgi:hypothetical protein